MADTTKKGRKEPKDPVFVEISKDTLAELLKSKDLIIGKNVRVVKALEISPESAIAKKFDR